MVWPCKPGHLSRSHHTVSPNLPIRARPQHSSPLLPAWQAEVADKQDRLRESAAAETELQELFHQRLDTLPTLAGGNATRSTELVRLHLALRR